MDVRGLQLARMVLGERVHHGDAQSESGSDSRRIQNVPFHDGVSTMTKSTSCLLMAATLAALITGSAQAGLINNGFETGDLTGWTANISGGTASVVTSNTTSYFASATYLPPEGSYFLAIQSGDADVWQTVSQSLAVAAGESIAGLAAFDWGDYLPYADGARVRILDTAGALVATPFYLDGNLTPGTQKDFEEPDSGYNGPWTAWSWTAASAGTYTVEFGARNTLDSGGPDPTFGLFDAHVVPEPASLALLGIGLVGLGAIRRKQRS